MQLTTYTRWMMEAFDENAIIGASTGFQSLFSQVPQYRTEDVIDIDIRRGNENKAVLVKRGEETQDLGKRTQGTKFTNITRKFPLLEEESSISVTDLRGREFGKTPYENGESLERARMKARDTHMTHVLKHVRAMEALAAQSIIDGEMNVLEDGSAKLDFYRRADHNVTVANAWGTGTATPLSDLEGAVRKIRRNGHVNADVALMGEGSVRAFLADVEVQKLADNRRFELINIDRNIPAKYARMIANGFSPVGKIVLPAINGELYIFSYHDGYTTDAGVYTPYLADEKVIVMATTARYDRIFGPSDVLPEELNETTPDKLFGMGAISGLPMIKGTADVIQGGMFFMDARFGGNNKSVVLRTQSAPIFCPTMIDAIVSIDTLVQ